MGQLNNTSPYNPNSEEQNKWMTARKALCYLVCCDLVSQVESSLGDTIQTDATTLANLTLSSVISAASSKAEQEV